MATLFDVWELRQRSPKVDLLTQQRRFNAGVAEVLAVAADQSLTDEQKFAAIEAAIKRANDTTNYEGLLTRAFRRPPTTKLNQAN